MKKLNLAGHKFGRLTAIAEGDPIKRELRWLCRCDCGQSIVIRRNNLTSGQTKSCGCFHVEQIKKANTTHGFANSPEYRTWSSMITRCTNPKSNRWSIYGGRGITVCERWKKFENFLADMGKRPEGTSIDRISVNGNYGPGNCRWATSKEQANNRRQKLKAI